MQVERLADEVARTYFPAPDGFFDNPIEFHVLGMDGPHDTWQPIFEGYRTLAVAPFVGRTALDAIVRMGDGKRMLVSSREELDKLPGDALAAWSRICVLSDTALDEPEDGDAGRPSGLHAKILAVEHAWDVTWFVGSANLTAAAFNGRNVEVMAALTARKVRRNGKTGHGIELFPRIRLRRAVRTLLPPGTGTRGTRSNRSAQEPRGSPQRSPRRRSQGRLLSIRRKLGVDAGRSDGTPSRQCRSDGLADFIGRGTGSFPATPLDLDAADPTAHWARRLPPTRSSQGRRQFGPHAPPTRRGNAGRPHT